MNPDKSLQNLFCEALEREGAVERARFLDDACGADAALRERVENLLRAREEIGAFMAQPSRKPAGLDLHSTGRGVLPLTEKPGNKIGRYKLLQQIGEGGCGVVYMAEQEEPVRRRVALKVIKLGMDTKQVIARFEAERQALALMDHPNIAKVLDAGTTEADKSEIRNPKSEIPIGRPYFVMELVRGIKITDFCDQNRLSTGERLKLFMQVCQAIQHAHQKGIIHRDIKPSNILVTSQDGVPVPKVIDFGIAKATTDQRLTDKTVFTAFEQFIGTPAYMSPEQAEMSALDIDTRSDIYSLGVLLYELLTGSPPFDQKELLAAGLDEMRRIIRETEPPRPSNRLSTMAAAALTTTAHHRHTEPPRLVHLVRGDLDWIVMKALEKDRSRRYETANGFAMDVQRYLANEPVTACPPSTAYRLRKFVKRHKSGVAIAALAMLFLVLVGSGFGWAVRERSARQSRVTGQVELVLAEVDQLLLEQKWAEALTVVRRAEAAVNSGEAGAETTRRVREQLKDLELIDRLEQIRMKRSAWIDGKFDLAGPNLEYEQSFRDYGVDAGTLPVETAVELLKARQPFAMPLAAALDDWADAHWRLKNDAAGAKRLVVVARGIDPEPLRDKVRSTWGKPASEVGDELQRIAETIDIRAQHPATIGILEGKLRRVKRPDAALRLLRDAQNVYPADFWLNYMLAHQLAEKTDYEGAVRFYTAAVAIRPHAVAARNNLGLALGGQERLDEAIACYRRAIDIDPNFVVAYNNLGVALGKQGKLDEALACYRMAIELDPNDAHAYNNLGGLLCDDLKDYDQAIAAYRKAIELKPKNAQTYDNLGIALHSQKKLDEAIAAYRKAIELAPDTARFHNNLGLVLRDQKKLDEAVAASRKAIELDPKDAGAYINLGNTLHAQEKLDEAIVAYRKAIELAPDSARAYRNLGLALNQQKRHDEAITAFRKGIELDPKSSVGYRGLGGVLRDQKKLDEAIVACGKAIELDPNDTGAYHNLGVALSDQKKLDEAVAVFKKAIELDPKSANEYFSLGAVLGEQNKLDDAIAAYRKAIEVDPNFALAYGNLGNALGSKGKLDEAVAVYRRAIELDPKYAVAYWNLGDALRKEKKLDEAVAAYRKGVEIEPKDARAYNNLGILLKDQGKLDEALAAYRKAIELDPRHTRAYSNLGAALRNEKLDEAAAALRKAIELDPEFSGAHNNLGALLCDGRLDYEGAAASFRKAIDLDPKNTSAHSNLGNALAHQGKLPEAIASYKKALAIDPQSADAHLAFAWLLATASDPKFRDPEQAVAHAREAVELDAVNPDCFLTLGVACYRAGDWKAAISAFEKATAFYRGDDRVDWFFLAMTHWQLGDKAEARNWYDRSVAWMKKQGQTHEELSRFRKEAVDLLGVKDAIPQKNGLSSHEEF